MLLHFGIQTYGKIDEVPGVFHRGTRFFHFQFMPVLPLGGVVILHSSIRSGDDQPIPSRFSLVSVLVAYLRWSILASAIILFIAGLSVLSNNPPRGKDRVLAASVSMGIGVALFAAWWCSHYITRASYKNAIRIADEIGLDHGYLDNHFRLTESMRTDGTMAQADLPKNIAELADLKDAKKKLPADDVFRLE